MTAYPPELTDAEGERFTDVIKDWAVAHGLTVRPPPTILPAEADPADLLATAVPVTLFPSPFPEVCFEQAVAVQKAYNALYAAISQDEEFLAQIVKDIGDSDDFITELWKVHLRVKKEGYVQRKSLGLFRSDYMVHQDASGSGPQVKQVEFNTIAASFGGLSAQTTQLHKYLAATEYPQLEHPIKQGSLRLPDNESAQGLAAGMREAFSAYGAARSGAARPKCVLFVVQGGERNVFDQRHLEYELQQLSVPVFRVAFSEVLARTRIDDGAGRALLYAPPHLPSDRGAFEVAVVYLRAGYGPDDYPDAAAWDARFHLERSAAIKCPTVLTQIAGTKKVQQVLATPTTTSAATATSSVADAPPLILEQFLRRASSSSSAVSDASAAAAQIARTFTNIYPLDGASAAGQRARALAQDPAQSQSYVLKPQREGGGNNVYRGAIPGFLGSVPEAHWGSYVLMELITPPPVRNTILRAGRLERGGVICELGVYGSCVWDAGSGAEAEILHNATAGYLLRTKGDQSEEGGVAAGFGCMDSIAFE